VQGLIPLGAVNAPHANRLRAFFEST
jgi:hypothetical protein